MAGRKLPVLPVLATFPEPGDLLYVVDVSDTSESPQGTSKQMERETLLDAGTYTPTISAETNGIVIAPQQASFIKVGNIVNVFAQLEITMDAGETTGSFEISLPVASNLASQKDCFGMMQYTSLGISTTELDVVYIEAETTNNTCLVNVETLTAGATLTYCTLQFTYEIL